MKHHRGNLPTLQLSLPLPLPLFATHTLFFSSPWFDFLPLFFRYSFSQESLSSRAQKWKSGNGNVLPLKHESEKMKEAPYNTVTATVPPFSNTPYTTLSIPAFYSLHPPLFLFLEVAFITYTTVNAAIKSSVFSMKEGVKQKEEEEEKEEARTWSIDRRQTSYFWSETARGGGAQGRLRWVVFYAFEKF